MELIMWMLLELATWTSYLSNVAGHVHLFMVFPDGCGLVQQDNATCHKAKMVQKWFEEQKEYEVLICPPDSPDINPIEQLWDGLDKHIRFMEVLTCNLEHIKDLLLPSWSQIPRHTLRVVWSPHLDRSGL